MIRITIKAPFVGGGPLRVFYSSCKSRIRELQENGTIIFVEKNSTLRVEETGYGEVQKCTVVEVESEDKLTEPQISKLVATIRFLIENSFYRPDNWGEVTFVFSTTIVVV